MVLAACCTSVQWASLRQSSSFCCGLPPETVQPPWLLGLTCLRNFGTQAQQPQNCSPMDILSCSCSCCLHPALSCVCTRTVLAQPRAGAAHPSSSAAAAAGDPLADGLGDAPALSEASQSSSDDSEAAVGGGTGRLARRCKLPDSMLCRCGRGAACRQDTARACCTAICQCVLGRACSQSAAAACWHIAGTQAPQSQARSGCATTPPQVDVTPSAQELESLQCLNDATAAPRHLVLDKSCHEVQNCMTCMSHHWLPTQAHSQQPSEPYSWQAECYCNCHCPASHELGLKQQ